MRTSLLLALTSLLALLLAVPVAVACTQSEYMTPEEYAALQPWQRDPSGPHSHGEPGGGQAAPAPEAEAQRPQPAGSAPRGERRERSGVERRKARTRTRSVVPAGRPTAAPVAAAAPRVAPQPAPVQGAAPAVRPAGSAATQPSRKPRSGPSREGERREAAPSPRRREGLIARPRLAAGDAAPVSAVAIAPAERPVATAAPPRRKGGDAWWLVPLAALLVLGFGAAGTLAVLRRAGRPPERDELRTALEPTCDLDAELAALLAEERARRLLARDQLPD